MTISTQWLVDMNSEWEIVNPKLIFQERSLRSYSDDIHLTPSQVYGVLPQTEYMEKNGTGVVQNIVSADSMKHVEVVRPRLRGFFGLRKPMLAQG